MITITRSLARQVRAVFRRAGIKPLGSCGPQAQAQTGPDGLRIRAMTPDTAVEYHQPGALEPEELSVPLEFFDDCQAKQDEPVTLEANGKKRVTGSWRDRGIPQLIEYDSEPSKKPFPEAATTLVINEPGLWQAFKNASEVVDRESIRYSLGNFHLRSEGGLLSASDGRQIYQNGGFQFPWTGDVMIPALGVLGCADLAEQPVEIGKTEQSLTLRIGHWTLILSIDTVGRFPKLDDIVAAAESGTSILRLTPADAEFLANALPRLPDPEESQHAITLDLNTCAMVRAKGAESGPLTELILSNAAISGAPIRVQMNRQYLSRALKLGLHEIRFTAPEHPMLAADEQRKYIWTPLSGEGALGPADDAVRIESAAVRTESRQPKTKSKKRRFATTEPSSAGASANGTAASQTATSMNGQAAGKTVNAAAAKAKRNKTAGPSGRSSGLTALEQAVALRDSLRGQAKQAGDLVRSIKRQRRDANLVRSTLESLKQLQAAG